MTTSKRAGPWLGVSMMMAAQVVMPLNDTLAKYLVQMLPVMQVAWSRFFFNAVLLMPVVMLRHRSKIVALPYPRLQLVRGLVIVSANVCFIMAVRYVPIADALALVFIAPLVVTALSPFALRERVGAREWFAVAIGFAGALIIIRPGFATFEWPSLLPLAAGTLFGIYLIITRRLAGSAPVTVTMFITAGFGAVALSLLLPWFWQAPTLTQFAMMFVVGVASGAGHLLITAAHEHAAASVLAPLTYTSIVTAAIAGYIVFGDIPDLFTWIGAAVVIASGLLIGLRRSR